MEIIEAQSDEQIKEVARLAKTIWTEHYTPIIGLEQAEYMIVNFQSKTAIAEQIKEKGYDYFLLVENGNNIGYMGLQVQDEQLFLSKIYVSKECRGKGYGSKSFEFADKYAKENNCSEIYLTVNKNNHTSIAVYEKSGFVKTDAVVAEIGNGYVMDDYIMTRECV